MTISNPVKNPKWILPAPMVLAVILYSCQGLPIPTPESKYKTNIGRVFCAAHGFRMVESLSPNDKIIVVQTGHQNTAVAPDKSFMTQTNEVALYMQGANISCLDPHPSQPAFAVSPDGKYVAGGTYSSVTADNLKYLLKEERPISDWEENKLNSSLFIIKELGKERQIIDVLYQPPKYRKNMICVDWSSDNKKVYYSYYYSAPVTGTTSSRIESYELSSGQKEVVLYDRAGYNFKISPDGEKLLIKDGIKLVVYNMRTKERKEVYFQQTKIPDSPYSLGWIAYYAWAPDSEHFVFTDQLRGLLVTNIANPDRENQKPLFNELHNGEYYSTPPACRPDSKEVVFWDRGANGLTIANYETGEVKRGVFSVEQDEWIGGNGCVQLLTWSKDGRYLAGNIFVGSGIPGNKLFNTPATPVTEHYLFVIDFQKKEIMVPGFNGQYPLPTYFVEDPEITTAIKNWGYENNDQQIKRALKEVKEDWRVPKLVDKIKWLKRALKGCTPTAEVRKEAEAQIKQWEAELAGQSEPPKPK